MLVIMEVKFLNIINVIVSFDLKFIIDMVIYDFVSTLEYICKLIILKIIIYKFILNGIMGKIKINL